MNPKIQYISIAISLIIMFIIMEFVRKRKLREEYSLVWIFAGLILIIFSLWRDFLTLISNLLGIYYPPATLFLFAIFIGLILFIHFSIVISREEDKSKILAQEIALLKEKLEKLEKDKSV